MNCNAIAIIDNRIDNKNTISPIWHNFFHAIDPNYLAMYRKPIPSQTVTQIDQALANHPQSIELIAALAVVASLGSASTSGDVSFKFNEGFLMFSGLDCDVHFRPNIDGALLVLAEHSSLLPAELHSLFNLLYKKNGFGKIPTNDEPRLLLAKVTLWLHIPILKEEMSQTDVVTCLPKILPIADDETLVKLDNALHSIPVEKRNLLLFEKGSLSQKTLLVLECLEGIYTHDRICFLWEKYIGSDMDDAYFFHPIAKRAQVTKISRYLNDGHAAEALRTIIKSRFYTQIEHIPTLLETSRMPLAEYVNAGVWLARLPFARVTLVNLLEQISLQRGAKDAIIQILNLNNRFGTYRWDHVYSVTEEEDEQEQDDLLQHVTTQINLSAELINTLIKVLKKYTKSEFFLLNLLQTTVLHRDGFFLDLSSKISFHVLSSQNHIQRLFEITWLPIDVNHCEMWWFHFRLPILETSCKKLKLSILNEKKLFDAIKDFENAVSDYEPLEEEVDGYNPLLAMIPRLWESFNKFRIRLREKQTPFKRIYISNNDDPC